MFSGKAARDFFRCGTGSKKFSNHSEKNLAPRFSEHRNRKLWCANGLGSHTSGKL
nr:hypothetical protein [Porphyromonas gulae]